jgi:rhamnulokinase
VDAIHVVGGGARNRLLCQLTADACGRPVLAGPVEATALGNVLAQAIATGSCGSWADAHALVRRGFPSTPYEPREPGAWDDAYARFVSFA